MTRKKTKRKKIKLTEQEKEQRCQEREVRTVMTNIGFKRIPNIGGKEFVYKSRTSEMDDIFYYKNVILILEYTVGQPGEHLLKKNYLYEKINENQNEFIDFLLNEDK
ncbi:hypothetical protein KKA14_00760, partial [bacterium]|nr:hypothetical protein [bacterium]